MMIGLNTFESSKNRKLILTKELEEKSKFGIPNQNLVWYWKDDLGNVGSLKGTTEMEALDRLREAFEEVGRIQWITKDKYQEMTK